MDSLRLLIRSEKVPVRLFRGRECEHRHEYAQIKEIYCLLTEFSRDQTIFMITNLRVNNGEIDCLLLRPNGPVILELKAYCGKIFGTENDRFWHVITHAGKKIELNCNLHSKAEKYRFDILDKLRKKITSILPDIDEKRIRNISSWGYFERGSEYQSDQVDLRIAKWFNIVTADTLIEELDISKSGYILFEKDLQSIVDDLHVEPYSIACGASTPLPIETIKEEVHEEEIMAQKPPKSKVSPTPTKGVFHSPKKDTIPVKYLIGFDKIWENIEINSDQEFRTKDGIEFTYSINNAYLFPSLQGWDGIPRVDFEMAHAFGACDNPECYGGLFIGSKLIWAILHDSRINS